MIKSINPAALLLKYIVVGNLLVWLTIHLCSSSFFGIPIVYAWQQGSWKLGLVLLFGFWWANYFIGRHLYRYIDKHGIVRNDAIVQFGDNIIMNLFHYAIKFVLFPVFFWAYFWWSQLYLLGVVGGGLPENAPWWLIVLAILIIPSLLGLSALVAMAPLSWICKMFNAIGARDDF